MKPIDVATHESIRFVASQTAASASVLEIGCGRGELARELACRGHRVTAIDSDAEAVETAREFGVHAVVASWPDFSSPPVDTVLFSRSLHHIRALDAALTQARRAMAPGGRLLVEDFAFESPDRSTLRWFVEVSRSSTAQRLMRRAPDEFVTALGDAADPLSAWSEGHHHDLHRFETMLKAVSALFEIDEVVEVPYLYRYLVPAVSDSVEAARWIAKVLAEEAELGGRGDIVQVGRRIVARGLRGGRRP